MKKGFFEDLKEDQTPIVKIATWIVTTLFGSFIFRNNKSILVAILLLPIIKRNHYRSFFVITSIGIFLLFFLFYYFIITLIEIRWPKLYKTVKRAVLIAFLAIYLIFEITIWPSIFTNFYWPSIQQSLFEALGYHVFFDDTVTVKKSDIELRDIFDMTYFDDMDIQKLYTEEDGTTKDVFKAFPSLRSPKEFKCERTDIADEEITNAMLYYYLNFKDSEEAVQHKNTAYGAMQLAIWCIDRNYDPKNLIIVDDSDLETAERTKSFVQKLYNKKSVDRSHALYIRCYKDNEWTSISENEHMKVPKVSYNEEGGKEYYRSPWFSISCLSNDWSGTIKSVSYDVILQDAPEGAIVVDSSYYYKKHFETDSPTTTKDNLFCILVPKSSVNNSYFTISLDMDREYYDVVCYRASDGQILLTTGTNSYSKNVTFKMMFE